MSELLPFQKRVIDEELDLNEKIEKLEEFMDGDIFQTLKSDEQERLDEQLLVMKQYAFILSERIAAFGSAEDDEIEIDEDDEDSV